MTRQELIASRRTLGRTQRELAGLLGKSIKAIHSYEQGWRDIPAHVEGHVLLLLAKKRNLLPAGKPCWETLDCAVEVRNCCPAWEFQAGDSCWSVNGTICNGQVQPDWESKMRMCRRCVVVARILALLRNT